VEAEAPAERFDSAEALEETLKALEQDMRDAAKRLDFERAAELRDRIKSLRKLDLTLR